ncbi:MAG: hypothetical protein K9M75_12250 [Phycisphaerae bacterium]|nr:hypothetical protein [Phycisphaerae bacterium]
MAKLNILLFIAAVIGSMAFNNAGAAQLPGPANVENLSQASAAAFDTFITETFPCRAQLQYSGSFIDPANTQKIAASAKTAANSLDIILKSQQFIQRSIEQYEGKDWDELFGKTSLWRAAVAAVRQTQWRICVVDYHHAIASAGEEKKVLLKKVIEKTNQDSDYSANEEKLLNIQASSALTPQKNTNITIRRLDSLIASSGIDNEVFYQAVIMRMKLSQVSNAAQITSLADSLKNSGLKNNFELLFKLALEELKEGGDTIIRSLAASHRPAAYIAGRVILNDIAAKASTTQLLTMTLKTKTPAEAFLAAAAGITEQNAKYAAVFDQMCKIEKFQNHAAYLAAAVSCRLTQPAQAVNYYMTSAQKAKDAGDPLIDMKPAEIARQGARLAYDIYYKDSSYLTTAKQAIELYFAIAGNKTDEELTYRYASMIIESEEIEKAILLLNIIAAGNGKYSNDATLDLIFYKVKNSQPQSPQRKELIVELEKFIAKLSPSKHIRPGIADQTLMLYCKLLIEEGGKNNAETALDILEKKTDPQSTEIIILKAAALAETGSLIQAAQTLAPIANLDSSKGASLAAAIVTGILENIDEYEDKVDDFNAFTNKCRNLARFAAASITDDNQAENFQKKYIEISIIAAQKGSETINAVQSLLNETQNRKPDDIDYLRCRARLYMKQDRYAEAFSIWSSIAQERKPRSASEDKSPKWWTAKYYALKCYAKISDPKNNDLNRAIDILISTNKNIPQFWKKKLTNLKSK